MQHPANSTSTTPIVATSEGAAGDAAADDGSSRLLPDAQLWRDAIGAARRAAAAAAELRTAFEAARPVRHS